MREANRRRGGKGKAAVLAELAGRRPQRDIVWREIHSIGGPFGSGIDADGRTVVFDADPDRRSVSDCVI